MQHFNIGTSSQDSLDKALKIAKIEQLRASAAKVRQDTLVSTFNSYGVTKT
jgi:hypothetical protein